MKIAACLVTRGDVDLDPVMDSIPAAWDVHVWDNSRREDVQVLGRWRLIDETDADLIYVQDDDCVLDEPMAVLDAYAAHGDPDAVMCNMPPEFRGVYAAWPDALVGFGAVMHRDIPALAIARFAANANSWAVARLPRCCDIAVTGLSPLGLCDIEKRNLPHALAEDRMWRQHDHVKVRARFRSEVERIRNAG